VIERGETERLQIEPSLSEVLPVNYIDFLPIAFKLENQCSLQAFEDESAGESLQWDRPQAENTLVITESEDFYEVDWAKYCIRCGDIVE